MITSADNTAVWPDAALFDLDGTLVDREPLMGEAVRRVLGAHRFPVDEQHLATTIGRAWTDVHVELERVYGFDWAFEEFMALVLGEAEALVAGGFETRVLDGGRELIERLREHSVPVAIVTGSLRREVPTALALVGIADHLTLVLAAEDYQPGKPHPACYLLAAQILGADPARCVVFEDSAHGVASGVAAGMRVIATGEANAPVGHLAHQDLSQASLVVERLSDVLDEHLLMPTQPTAE